jgi:hypothetical protein
MLSDVYARAGEGVTLESAFEEEAKSGITNLPTGLLHPVALYRLRKLTGLNDTPSDGNIMAEAIKGLDPSFVTEFDQATTGIAWSGTYVGNAFGFGIRKHYGKTPEAKDVIRIVQIMMKMVAAAYRYNQVVGCAPFSLSTVKPGLAVEAKKHQLILDEVAGFRDVDRALASLRGGSGRLYLAGRDNQVEVGYKEE